MFNLNSFLNILIQIADMDVDLENLTLYDQVIADKTAAHQTPEGDRLLCT